MRMNLVSAVSLALALASASGTANAQSSTPPSEAVTMQNLSLGERNAVIAAIKSAFRASYVFPEKVSEILAALDRAKAAGRYDAANPNEFAGRITSDLQEVSQDRHVFLAYEPGRYAAAAA